ncbi:MAG: hypothetical protein JJU34_11945 [Lunatimonas sp.]|uniref:hypothetical protein n=1 Tax=Lunatimonas sp. TaxID=2060141 RepID=UPI00263A68D7|nr:hypothetical protein [Lunatimonas sp.]MCC5937983.1 hypothetical protein [Lunatimonas sp.]
MNRPLALFLSRIAHPLVILTFFVFYSNLRLQELDAALWTITAMLAITIVPLIVWNWLKWKQGVYSNFDVSVREQRFSMFGFVFVLAAILIAFLFLSNQPQEILFGSLILIQVILITFLLNFRLKSSLHLAVCTYIAMGMVPLNGPMALGLMLLTPLLAWARVSLGRHQWNEVITGSMLGTGSGIQLLYLTDYL